MRVYLVRHAEAEAAAPGGDAARRLSAAGRSRFGALASALAPTLSLSRVLTSPLARARETAALLATACGGQVVEEEALRSGRSSGRELLALAGRAGPGAALVGHNPELREAIVLASGRDEPVPPGTVAALEWTPAGARLLWLRSP